jgi:hypothetical protein
VQSSGGWCSRVDASLKPTNSMITAVLQMNSKETELMVEHGSGFRVESRLF